MMGLKKTELKAYILALILFKSRTVAEPEHELA